MLINGTKKGRGNCNHKQIMYLYPHSPEKSAMFIVPCFGKYNTQKVYKATSVVYVMPVLPHVHMHVVS
jgi:hypothetical protein